MWNWHNWSTFSFVLSEIKPSLSAWNVAKHVFLVMGIWYFFRNIFGILFFYNDISAMYIVALTILCMAMLMYLLFTHTWYIKIRTDKEYKLSCIFR